MVEDFSALDLLSSGGFRLSAPKAAQPVTQKQNQKKAARLRLRHARMPLAARRIALLLPGVRRKVERGALQGWPMRLSWPTRDVVHPDLWQD